MSSFNIEKLNDSNYHSWKQKIFHLLVLKDLGGHIEGNRPEKEEDQPAWDASDAKAQAFIALTLSDQLLENVRDVGIYSGRVWTPHAVEQIKRSAQVLHSFQVWGWICSLVFQPHTRSRFNSESNERHHNRERDGDGSPKWITWSIWSYGSWLGHLMLLEMKNQNWNSIMWNLD